MAGALVTLVSARRCERDSGRICAARVTYPAAEREMATSYIEKTTKGRDYSNNRLDQSTGQPRTVFLTPQTFRSSFPHGLDSLFTPAFLHQPRSFATVIRLVTSTGVESVKALQRGD